MLAALSVEIAKLNRSLAALLAIAAPGLIGLFSFLVQTRTQSPMQWDGLVANISMIWAFFMLPMSVTALTALMANMEHGPKSWDHLRALPVPRWRIYAAKAVCTAGLVAAMSVGVLLAGLASGWLISLVRPEVAPIGALDLHGAIRTFAMMWAASLLMIAVQLWVALRFSSFVPGLVLGIGGTFFAVVATGAKEGVFMPWQMPVNVTASAQEAWRVPVALGLGGIGGLVALALMLTHLSRREVL
ncbi:MAG TPA: ABC transporter permease [Hyphomonadaceae bacterium]|jgi:ABC-2 type transport system permease protein|nr:ABC transporter permease [Hyphomonadaceae bacterium]